MRRRWYVFIGWLFDVYSPSLAMAGRPCRRSFRDVLAGDGWSRSKARKRINFAWWMGLAWAALAFMAGSDRTEHLAYLVLVSVWCAASVVIDEIRRGHVAQVTIKNLTFSSEAKQALRDVMREAKL